MPLSALLAAPVIFGACQAGGDCTWDAGVPPNSPAKPPPSDIAPAASIPKPPNGMSQPHGKRGLCGAQAETLEERHAAAHEFDVLGYQKTLGPALARFIDRVTKPAHGEPAAAMGRIEPKTLHQA